MPTNGDDVEDKALKLKVGIANFEDAKLRAGGLSAFDKTEEGKKWLAALVPKDDKEGKKIFADLGKSLENPDLFDERHGEQDFIDFQCLLEETKAFYTTRIKMYRSVLLDEAHGDEAKRQICTLTGILDDTFRRGYANIYETWIKVGDKEALGRWTTWANKQMSSFESEEKISQSSTHMASCYKDAYDDSLKKKYEAFFTDVASKTGGTYERAPMKSPQRATEKTAFRYDEDRRWKCDNVYDVQRGCISYSTMEGIRQGAEMICNSKMFKALLLKDRLSDGKQTSSGWGDALLNGRFLGFNTHVVEIQLHHKKLVSIREDMGGHYLYSIFRSLVEALEVVFGDEETKKIIAEHAPRKIEGGAGGSSVVDKQTAEINELKVYSDSLKLKCSNLEKDKNKLADENRSLKSDMGSLADEIEMLKQQNRQLNQTLQGSASSTNSSSDDNQWHVKLLEWIEANKIPADRFKPSYPKTIKDLVALTEINASSCKISGKLFQ
jgi:FtsZ-binding cell division protein ZapB